MATLLFVLLKALPVRAAGLALVLAVDVSASVTPDSYVLQRDGIARAFENTTLVQAISAVPDGIEVMMLEWSDPDKIAVTVGWTRVADRDSAAAFSAVVRATRRSSSGLTAIGPALLAAAAAFERLPEPAQQRMIDLSGDGMANLGVPPRIARDRIVAAGISINGLAILTQEPWLEGYYRSNVIGGSGAFVMVARDFGSFADAMTRKLVNEIAGGASGGAREKTADSGACPSFAAFLSSCAADGSTALASSPAETRELSEGPQGGSGDLSTLR
jgi:Ca-activated chloride channel family protein